MQHLAFCPKCRFEELGDIVAGLIEVEHAWYVHVSARGAPSVSALRALRTVPDFTDVPLTTLARRLRDGALTVGPFLRGAEAQHLLAELQAAGLVAELSKDSEADG